jgi:hypothetical protein
MTIHWIMGPEASRNSGVNQYSQILISDYEAPPEIIKYYFRGPVRSIKRYVDQFLITPIKIAFKVKKNDVVILYQEDVAFISLFARLKSKNILPIIHHYPHVKRGYSFLEVMKWLFLKINLLALNLCELVICPSATTKADLVKVFRGMIVVIENPFNFKQKNPSIDKALARRQISELLNLDLHGKFLILAVGSEESRKNYPPLLRALAGEKLKNEIFFLKIGRPIDWNNRSSNQEILENSDVAYSFIDEY